MSKAIIFSGGYAPLDLACKEEITEDDYIICADCGVKYCERLGLKADLWIGDFDSADFEITKSLDAVSDAEIIRLNPIKDDTDTEFALDCAIKRGYRDILVFGALGSRADHSLANIFLLEKYSQKGVRIRIIDDKNIIHFVFDSTIYVTKGMKYVSLLPLDTVTVSNDGFMYQLSGETMYRYSSRGISNELICQNGSITVCGGAALVIESKD